MALQIHRQMRKEIDDNLIADRRSIKLGFEQWFWLAMGGGDCRTGLIFEVK